MENHDLSPVNTSTLKVVIQIRDHDIAPLENIAIYDEIFQDDI